MQLRKNALVIILGCIIPLLTLLILKSNNIELTDSLEPGKYTASANGLLDTGRFVYLNKATGKYQAELERLPLYPAFIAISYRLFGAENNLSVVLIQLILSGLTVLGVALTARNLNSSWYWPTAILGSLCFNVVYRATTIMPETLFIFLITWGMYFNFRILNYPSRWFRYILMSSAFFCLAQLTRPASILLPIFTILPLFYLLKKKLNFSAFNSALASLLPPFLMFVFAIFPIVLKNHSVVGHYIYNTQRGRHALFWLYPCLQSPWGCGKRDRASLVQVKKKFFETAHYSGNVKDDEIMVHTITNDLAHEYIKTVPLLQLFKASFGAAIKLLIHTSVLEPVERLGHKTVHISDAKGKNTRSKVYSFINNSFSTKYNLLILISEILVLIMRILQVIGFVYAYFSEKYKYIAIWCAMSALSFVVVSIGIGNFRYRAPAEPMLLILSVLGLECIFERLKNAQGIQVASRSLLE